MKFSDCPIWILFSLRSKRPLCGSTDLLSSRETSVFPLVNTVSDRLGFWELGCEHLLVLTVLHAVFGSSRIFFAVLRLWMIFSTALRFLIDPLILPYSGVPHGFLFCKLKISLSKITDLPFRFVPCLKLEQTWVSYVFWNCMWNSFNFFFLIFFLIFSRNKCFCLSHFTPEFGTESEGLLAESWGFCARQLDPAFVCIIMS